MLGDPGALGGAQVQAAAIEQHPGTAAGPAPQDVQSVVVTDTVQRLIDQAQQGRIVTRHGEAKGTPQVLDEMINLDTAKVDACDQVVTAYGITEKDVGVSQ
ncbi:hypothetical protein D3C77_540650 [compost metagenome]